MPRKIPAATTSQSPGALLVIRGNDTEEEALRVGFAKLRVVHSFK